MCVCACVRACVCTSVHPCHSCVFALLTLSDDDKEGVLDDLLASLQTGSAFDR